MPSTSIVSKSGGLTFEPHTAALITSAYFLKLIFNSSAKTLKQVSILLIVNSSIFAIDEAAVSIIFLVSSVLPLK